MFELEAFSVCSDFIRNRMNFVSKDFLRVIFPSPAIVQFYVHHRAPLCKKHYNNETWMELTTSCSVVSPRRKLLTIALLCQRNNAQDVDGTMKKMYKFDVWVYDVEIKEEIHDLVILSISFRFPIVILCEFFSVARSVEGSRYG